MGGGGGNPISAAQAEADRLAARTRAERDRAARKAKAERDRAARAAQAERDRAARAAEAENVRAANRDYSAMAQAEGQRAIDAAATNIDNAGAETEKMLKYISKSLLGTEDPSQATPSFMDTNSDNGPTAAYGSYGSGKGKSGKGGSKRGKLESERSRQTFSKSSLYARRKNK